MKQKFASKLWKRTLSTGLSLAMAVTMLPSAGILAAQNDPVVHTDPVTLKAGSVAATDDTTTNNQPFTSKTGSTKFASPAFTVRQVVKVRDGQNDKLVKPSTGMTADLMFAAAEARYDTTGESGGQDIMASVSGDGGSTWKYSYPFNFPDSAGSGNSNAVTVLNPVLVEETTRNTAGNGNGAVTGGTLYCLANVYPGGVGPMYGEAYTEPGVGTGYVEIGEENAKKKRLALTDDIEKAKTNPTAEGAGYDYYVGDFADGYAPVNAVNGDALATIGGKQYYVDKWYNLYTKSGDAYVAEVQAGGQLDAEEESEDQLQQNVFYKGSALHVYNTGYIMCVSSADGETWSDPEILNPQVYRDETEVVYLVSGSGLTTTAGRVVVPVYSTKNPATGRDDKASIIWRYNNASLCEHAAAGTPWAHRSNDVPAFEDDGEDDSPTWMQGGELVELSRGELRMFIRSGRGSVIYADAGRGLSAEDDENAAGTDMFTFTAPVVTDADVTPDAKVSSIEYSQIVNPGTDNDRIILAAMPTGSGGELGKLILFKNADKNAVLNPPITSIHEHTLTTGNFTAASMDEMNFGSNFGILWENGRGTVTFENFYMVDILQDASSDQCDLYVADLEYDLELRPNGTPYVRKYNVSGEQNMEPSDRNYSTEGGDNFTVAFDEGTPTEKTVPALYSRTTSTGGTNTEVQKLSAGFNKKMVDGSPVPDTDMDIENAEFTITKPSNHESMSDVYTIYSEKARRYLVNSEGETFFTASNRNNMKIVYDTQDTYGATDGFLLCRAGMSPARYIVFDKNANAFNAYGDLGPRATRFDYHLQFLMKLTAEEAESMNEDDVIVFSADHKYKKTASADEIVSGRKYLIAYETVEEAKDDADGAFPNGGYVILAPRNGMNNYSKLVYGTRTAQMAAVKTLTITPQAKTTTPVDLTVNNITYHITVRDTTITVPQGGSTFIDNVTVDQVDLGETDLVTKAAGTETRKALYDCKRNPSTKGSLDGYSDTPNWNANVADAEWIITPTGNETTDGRKLYTIYNEMKATYLTNYNATKYYQDDPFPQSIVDVSNNGEGNFEIRRYDPNNTDPKLKNRYMYFFLEKMAFDGLDTRNADWEAKGEFEFQLLKKKAGNIESTSDPIPGYERVSEVESGESYLITKYYHEPTGQERDVILVLYPTTGITNQSKMYAEAVVSGVKLTASDDASEGDKAEITIDGTKYEIEIGPKCDHDYTRIETNREATCSETGIKGRLTCSNCGEVLNEGTVLPLRDHDWSEWTATDPVIDRTNKTVTDGTNTRTCKVGKESQTEPIDGEAYLLKEIGKAIAAAEAEKAKTDDYAAETIKALDDAIKAATAAVSGETPADVAGQIDALVGLEEAVKPANLITKAAYEQKEEELNGLLGTAKENVTKTDVYTEDSLADLQAVLDQIDGMPKDEDGKLSYADMQTAITALNGVSLKTIAEKEEEDKVEQLAGDVKTTLDEVKAIAEASGSKDKYTTETWNKFINAYNQLKDKTEAELKAMTSTELETLLADLKTKLVEKQPVTIISGNKLQANTDHTIGNAVYTVTDAVKNEVVLKKGTDAKKFTVPATVSVNGITCKVVGIGDKAFSGFKKLKNVIIGENVTSIGAQAFAKCKKLSKVTINGPAPAIKKAAFKKTASKVTVKAKKLDKKQKKAFLNVLKKTGKISKKSVVK